MLLSSLRCQTHQFVKLTKTSASLPCFMKLHIIIIIIIIIIRVYLNRPELILSRGCGLAAQSWS